MSLDRYPFLRALLEELRQLEARERVRDRLVELRDRPAPEANHPAEGEVVLVSEQEED